MQLQLKPHSPHAVILFAFTLPSLPSALPAPVAYTSQLESLNTDLDPPPSLYSLDKAAWAVYVVKYIIFDLPKLTVEVKMVDGSEFKWPMTGEQTLLLQVHHDVQESACEWERKRRRDLVATVRQEDNAEDVSSEQSPSPSSTGHSHQGGGSSPMDQCQDKPPSAPSFHHDFDISALSTSDSTYPVRSQFTTKSISTSRVLRHRARSTLVDCFRRWVIPTIRERLQWGLFTPYDAIEPVKDGGGTKWDKMSTATNAYLDWACRSMIRRRESSLAELLHLHVPDVNSEQGDVESEPENTELDQPGMESRRSSISSDLVSPISGSSRASTSPDRTSLSDLDLGGSENPLIISTSSVSPLSSSSAIPLSAITQGDPQDVQRVAELLLSIDKLKVLHMTLGAKARAAADGHEASLRALEGRVCRRAWSSRETAAARRSPQSTRHYTVACPVSAGSAPSIKAGTFRPANTTEPGSNKSLLKLSIPTTCSPLGKISTTWEDWQIEWGKEKNFDETGEERDDAASEPNGHSPLSAISGSKNMPFTS
ncbi:hypothetical protein FRC18_011671 [Serendipita sp. 400]|nr:hypothetical protein FRC18_011671 [Serendipita sp. 400]